MLISSALDVYFDGVFEGYEYEMIYPPDVFEPLRAWNRKKVTEAVAHHNYTVFLHEGLRTARGGNSVSSMTVSVSAVTNRILACSVHSSILPVHVHSGGVRRSSNSTNPRTGRSITRMTSSPWDHRSDRSSPIQRRGCSWRGSGHYRLSRRSPMGRVLASGRRCGRPRRRSRRSRPRFPAGSSRRTARCWRP